MNTPLIAAALATVALAGCDIPAPTMAVAPTAYRTVSYYEGHGLERDQTLAWCHDNTALIAKVPSCENAIRARRDEFNSRMGFLTPVR